KDVACDETVAKARFFRRRWSIGRSGARSSAPERGKYALRREGGDTSKGGHPRRSHESPDATSQREPPPSGGGFLHSGSCDTTRRRRSRSARRSASDSGSRA